MKRFQFNGLGFPVILINAPIKDGIPAVNYNQMADAVFEALIRKPGRLSGAEVKFVRMHKEMTQGAFAEMVGVDRTSVVKWEAKDLKATEMISPTEAFLRMKMANLAKMNLNSEFPVIHPAVMKKAVGKPVEVSV